MMKKVLLSGVLSLLTISAVAQEFPRAEIAAMYSYARFGPAQRYTPGLNLNGGGGQVTINFNQYVGIQADLNGFGASKATFTIPVGDPVAPSGAQVTASGNLFSYLFGPQLKLRTHKVEPYFHALFGGAHTTLYANAFSACSGVCTLQANNTAAAKPSQNAFGMVIGGGFDIPVTHLIGLRVGEFDYLLTRFSNRLAPNNQNSFRYSAGIVFNFGNH